MDMPDYTNQDVYQSHQNLYLSDGDTVAASSWCARYDMHIMPEEAKLVVSCCCLLLWRIHRASRFDAHSFFDFSR